MSKQKHTFIDRYHMYPWYLNLSIVLFYIFGSISSPLYTSVLQYKNIKSDTFNGTVSPIEYVPEYLAMDSSDRDKSYLDLDSSVFIKIPKYDADILSRNIDDQVAGDPEYEETLGSRVIYTVPYMSSYNYDYLEYSGSHLAVDIKSPVGAPIRNIANGVIVDIGYQSSGFGNYVVIKHNNVPLSNGTIGTIYSGYAHMNEVYANIGKKIDKGSVIGTVGNTGMSFGSHLHFQIDVEEAPFHPYRPFTGKEAQDANVNFVEAINIGLGKANGLKYTINPLEFVNNNINNILVENNVEDTNLVASSTEEINVDEIVDENIVLNEEEVALLDNNIELESAREEVIEEPIEKKANNDKETIVEETVIEKETLEDIIKEEVEIIKIEKIDLFDNELISLDDDLIISDNSELALLDTNNIITNSNLNLLEDDTKDEIKEENVKETVIEKIKEEVKENVIKEENINNEIETINEITKLELPKEENINLFNDIDINSDNYEQIKFLKEKGVINGFSDNTFREDSYITRSEALKIFLLSFDIEKDINLSSNFDDVSSKSWENGYISKGLELSLVTSNNNNFYPNRTINRVEGLKILLKIADVDLSSYSSKEISLKDIDINDWFYKYIVYSKENNLLSIKNSLFEPEKPLTRGELVNMIYLMVEH